jgi:hypothetical protein
MDLRQHSMRFIGQPIVARHVNGTTHAGILHSVTNEGIYIRPYGARQVSGVQAQEDFQSASELTSNDQDVQQIFFGLGFLPWLALAGFWGGGLWW